MTRRGCLLDLWRRLGLDGNQANRSAEKTFVARDLHDFGALGAFHQDLDIPVGKLDALDDIRERADLIDFLGFRIVDGGVVLRDQKNLLVPGQRFFQRAHRRFAAHDERVHHLRKDDHVPHGHHGDTLHVELFPIKNGFFLSQGFPSRLSRAGSN